MKRISGTVLQHNSAQAADAGSMNGGEDAVVVIGVVGRSGEDDTELLAAASQRLDSLVSIGAHHEAARAQAEAKKMKGIAYGIAGVGVLSAVALALYEALK